MSDKYTDEEQKVWDVYFSAALPLAKAEAAATGNQIENSWSEVITHAGCIADNMIEERRNRKPLPEYHLGSFSI
ncbi:hypothetical protein [Pseudomonas savastanoi]|uniref:Uncharacterized protein n=1 Tax=Pseudomonas savastanoi pv. savastanoi NCPPB 3335 TaxID=693985 RepID=A0ABC8BE94_PSESS|nr:hypothetical protein [Pseudomonas savastanoi]ARD12436.1 hypothetical protein PSA3335_15995 [Pseudomonas savastanoi pv. savastanoi NCPPB 3335]MBA4706750.1 hypothetical protein [Pseudomonas savastanoi pv. savastanoi]